VVKGCRGARKWVCVFVVGGAGGVCGAVFTKFGGVGGGIKIVGSPKGRGCPTGFGKGTPPLNQKTEFGRKNLPAGWGTGALSDRKTLIRGMPGGGQVGGGEFGDKAEKQKSEAGQGMERRRVGGCIFHQGGGTIGGAQKENFPPVREKRKVCALTGRGKKRGSEVIFSFRVGEGRNVPARKLPSSKEAQGKRKGVNPGETIRSGQNGRGNNREYCRVGVDGPGGSF